MKFLPPCFQRRSPLFFFQVRSVVRLIILCSLGFFLPLAPLTIAHAKPVPPDPGPPGGYCLSGTLTDDGSLESDPTHYEKVTVHVFNLCNLTVNSLVATLSGTNHCPSLNESNQVGDLSLGSAGTLEYRKGSATLGGNCVDCHYQNGILVNTTYPPFDVSLSLLDITGTDSSGLGVGLGENSGMLQLHFTNGSPAPGAPSCPFFT